jgi:hypothetical protein
MSCSRRAGESPGPESVEGCRFLAPPAGRGTAEREGSNLDRFLKRATYSFLVALLAKLATAPDAHYPNCPNCVRCSGLSAAQRLTLFAGSSSFADAGEARPLIRTKHIRSKSEYFVQSGQQSRAFLLTQLREILRAPLDCWQHLSDGNIEQRPLRFTTFE